ncbi:MAG: cutA [Burkholderiales bacterium]|nr:cutA [Burkholderiales bacterium]
MPKLLVFTNLPDRASAERLADLLLEQRLAACVNILAPCRSVYRWKGAIQHDDEHPLLIKTSARPCARAIPMNSPRSSRSQSSKGCPPTSTG